MSGKAEKSGRTQEESRQLREMGKSIKVVRIRRDLAQDELAREAGLGKSHLSGIETGKLNPSFLTLSRIAQGLGVRIGELFEEVK